MKKIILILIAGILYGCETDESTVDCFQKADFGLISNEVVCGNKTEYWERYSDTTSWFFREEDINSIENQVLSFMKGQVLFSSKLKLKRISVDTLKETSGVRVYQYEYAKRLSSEYFYFSDNHKLIVVGNIHCNMHTYIRLDPEISKDVRMNCIADIVKKSEAYQNEFYPVPK